MNGGVIDQLSQEYLPLIQRFKEALSRQKQSAESVAMWRLHNNLGWEEVLESIWAKVQLKAGTILILYFTAFLPFKSCVYIHAHMQRRFWLKNQK